MSFMPRDITWNGDINTQVGKLPCGMLVSLEKSFEGIYADIGGEPVMEVFTDMDIAKDWVETHIISYVRHLSPADMVNARIDGMMLA